MRIFSVSIFLVLLALPLFAASDVPNGKAIAEAPTSPKHHYFSGAKDSNIENLQKGMTRAEVRKTIGGKEYPAFETNRDGFTIAVDGKRSQYFTIRNWMPTPGRERDFFFSEKNLLYVLYDEGRLEGYGIYPLKNDPSATGNQVTPKRQKTDN